MTIEIRELIIEARVTGSGAPEHGKPYAPLAEMRWHERERLIDLVTQRVLKALREQRED